MSYGPVNRKTLASVNRVNRGGVQDSDLQEPQDPGESNDARELSLGEWLDKRGMSWNQYKTLDPGEKTELRSQYLKYLKENSA